MGKKEALEDKIEEFSQRPAHEFRVQAILWRQQGKPHWIEINEGIADDDCSPVISEVERRLAGRPPLDRDHSQAGRRLGAIVHPRCLREINRLS